MFFTDRTDSLLALVDFAAFVVGELPEGQFSLFAGKEELVDARFTRHLAVRHKTLNLKLKFFGVEVFARSVAVEEESPRESFHLFALDGKDRFRPIDHGAEIIPELDGGRVVLTFRHIGFDRLIFRVGRPFQRGFEVFLTDRRTLEIIPRKRVRSAPGLTEIPLRVGGPRPGVDRVAQLLIRQPLPRDIDDPERTANGSNGSGSSISRGSG